MDLAPITHEYALSCSAEHAFAVYTERIGEWWPADYSPDPAGLQDTVIEPGLGGSVYFVIDLGVEGSGAVPWGTVTAWQPGRRIAFESILAQSRDYPSEVAASFEPADGGCVLRFQHGGWNEGNAADRRKFGDWPRILDRFAGLAQS